MGSLSPSCPARARAQREPEVAGFFERRTCVIQYVVSDPDTGACAIIDLVLDYEKKSGSIATASADALLRSVSEQNLDVAWILDTHPHADHLSAAAYLREKTGAPTGIGERVVEIQRLWKDIYNLPDTFVPDGSQPLDAFPAARWD